MTNLCECGCGRQTFIPPRTDKTKSWVKGIPLRFASRACIKGKFHPQWRGGRGVNASGYIWVHAPEHPKAVLGMVYEHVLVAERALGRYLPDKAQVHHFNEQHGDNRGCNLVICEDLAYHKLLHKRMRAFKATGDPNAGRCEFCKKWEINIHRSPKGKPYHKECARKGWDAFRKTES